MELIYCLIGALTGSGVTGLVLALLQRKWAKDDKRDAIVEALKVLMVDRVRWMGKQCIAKNEISLSDKETLEGMHRAYKSLGGNGHLSIIMDEVERLPICKE